MTESVAEIEIQANTDPARKSIEDLSRTISGPLQDAVTSTVSNLESAFVSFARTGELNVRNMVNAIIADLARIAFTQFVKEPLTNLLNGLVGGLGDLFGGGTGTVAGTDALGGSVGFGRPYVVGEQGRELFVPETSGRIIPNNALGGGSIIFNVQATDAQSFRRSETQIAAMLNRLVSRGSRNL